VDLRRLGHRTLVVVGAIALCATRPICSGAAEPDAHPFVQGDDTTPAAPAEDQGTEAPDQQAAEGRSVFAPPDRTTLRLLAKARQLIDQDRYAEAVRCLGAILESSQDYFFHPDRSGAIPRSLKSEARQLLGDMSDRGRRLYELQYGARARQMLAEASAAGDAAGLAEVSRRFFHTQAGYEATFLLGLHHLDHGRPLAGALALERLREASLEAETFEPALSLAVAICWIRAGKPEKASRTLSALRERQPGALVNVAGEEVPLFAQDADVLEWLTGLLGPQVTPEAEQPSQWAMFRGDATRNASTAGDGPLLSKRWRVRTSDDPYLEALIEQIRDGDRDWDRSAVPALQPLVVGDAVLMRTARNLLAVDFATGKRIWEAPVDDPFDSLLYPAQSLVYRRMPQLEHAIRLRMWADATYGSMSSDGNLVYAVEGLGLEIGSGQFDAVLIGGRRSEDPAGPRPYNRLAAYEIRSEGKLKWHLGGSPDEYGLPQAGTFFLGPPLPLMGRLYVIAERVGEIRLIALEAQSGELVWSQQLAGADQELLKNPVRRIAGVSPSYVDGVLVCPTSNRSIVAVELASRSLLWGYTYPQSDARSRRQVVFLGAQSIVDPDPAGRWVDSSVILADGRVLATPVDSDCLHCLDLFDGKLLWKEPRGDDLYLACVHEGKAVLVGQRGVRALDLHKTRDSTPDEPPEGKVDETVAELLDADGLDEYERPAPAWDGRTVDYPEGSSPSGIGFSGLSAGSTDRRRALYHVPLSSAEVMAIDLDTGRSAGLFRSRQGNVPGNLVACRGRIISQDATGLEAFDQLEALREEIDQRLAAASDDTEALCLRGEILWNEGKLEDAIESLRRSLELQPDPDTRELLREVLIDGLRVDFAAHRDHAEEIRQLIDDPAQQATYLRWMAVGLAGAGELRSALEHYLKLIDLDAGRRDMERVDGSLAVRRDRWIQVRLAALGESASEEFRAEIDRVAAARLEEALAAEGPGAIWRFLEHFGAQPIAAEVRRHLVRRFRESGDLLGAELVLMRQERSPDEQLRAAAVAELAETLHASKGWHDAALCYDRLQRELADVVCLEGKTGREVVESLPADDPVRRELDPGSVWPTGRVVVAKSTPKTTPPPTYNQAPLEFDGSRGPFFSDVTVELHQAPLPNLVGRDGLGHEVWKLPLTELARQGDFLLNRSLMRVSVCGHLLVLTSGQRILAADTLGTDHRRLLWSRDLDQSNRHPSGHAGFHVQLANLAAGMPPIRLSGYEHDPMSLPRIVNEQLLCFRQLRNCIAVDPWTGETLWIRRNIPRDSELFGDHEYVFLVRPGETTATVLRAMDGTVLGEREVPAERERTLGRQVLGWQRGDDRCVLKLVDPWENRPLWPPKEFAAGAKLRYVEEETVGVYEPEGRFVLVDLSDGRTVIDAQLGPDRSLSEFLVLPSSDQYIVVLYKRVVSPDQVRRTFAMHGVTSAQIGRAQVYAFDRQGNVLWPSPVTVEDQWLPLSQPSRLPVLAFACMSQERQTGVQTPSKTSILCIDKRNGREVFREESAGTTNSFDLVGDREKNTVELRLQRNTVTMTFTDQPLESESGSGEAPKDSSSSAQRKGPAPVRALLKAIQAAVSGTRPGANGP